MVGRSNRSGRANIGQKSTLHGLPLARTVWHRQSMRRYLRGMTAVTFTTCSASVGRVPLHGRHHRHEWQDIHDRRDCRSPRNPGAARRTRAPRSRLVSRRAAARRAGPLRGISRNDRGAASRRVAPMQQSNSTSEALAPGSPRRGRAASPSSPTRVRTTPMPMARWSATLPARRSSSWRSNQAGSPYSTLAMRARSSSAEVVPAGVEILYYGVPARGDSWTAADLRGPFPATQLSGHDFRARALPALPRPSRCPAYPRHRRDFRGKRHGRTRRRAGRACPDGHRNRGARPGRAASRSLPGRSTSTPMSLSTMHIHRTHSSEP